MEVKKGKEEKKESDLNLEARRCVCVSVRALIQTHVLVVVLLLFRVSFTALHGFSKRLHISSVGSIHSLCWQTELTHERAELPGGQGTAEHTHGLLELR